MFATNSQPVLRVLDLAKTFNDVTAVDGVSFSLESGEIVGLLGPNGAGKTTTIHMLLGLITPSRGKIIVLGRDVVRDRASALAGVNFMAPYVNYPWRLTVTEILRVFAGLYEIPAPRRRIEELLDLFGLTHLRNTPNARLSSGERTRLGLCKALLNDPALLLLDEPTAYLDPEAHQHVLTVLLEMRRQSGTAFLYTSHNMAEVELLCDRVIFLHHGRVLAVGTPTDVTCRLLSEIREGPALEEVFLRVINNKIS